ncbi:MAG: hypothetical protein HUJ42_02410 [Malacoplasma sp.]|nr:hypothetical protein [Malacoplasma sp.]
MEREEKQKSIFVTKGFEELVDKFGTKAMHYRSLVYFQFKDENTKTFCELLIKFKLKLLSAIKVAIVDFVIFLLAFAFLTISKVGTYSAVQNNQLSIAFICFLVLAILIDLYLFTVFIRIYQLLKKMQFFEMSNKFKAIKYWKVGAIFYFCSILNLVCFALITLIYWYFSVSKIMNLISKNFQSFGIEKIQSQNWTKKDSNL